LRFFEEEMEVLGIKKSKFSRKHYKEIAKLFGLAREELYSHEWENIMEIFIEHFKKDNNQFSEHKFRDACKDACKGE
jgi:hypothetical protein